MNDLVGNTLNLLSTKIERFNKEKRRIFATSSFQTQSIPLLHLISLYFPDIPIIFLDTGFLFPETYAFKDKLEELLKLNIVSLKSCITPLQQIDRSSGLFQYARDPDRCCYINKVKPLEDFMQVNDVWISGVRRDQTTVRKNMDVIQKGDNGLIKFHPMLEWTNKAIYDYINKNGLPKHPLKDSGFISIGCIPCTHKWSGSNPRGGRWVGSKKTECGLHTKQN